MKNDPDEYPWIVRLVSRFKDEKQLTGHSMRERFRATLAIGLPDDTPPGTILFRTRSIARRFARSWNGEMETQPSP